MSSVKRGTYGELKMNYELGGGAAAHSEITGVVACSPQQQPKATLGGLRLKALGQWVFGKGFGCLKDGPLRLG